MNAVRYEYTEYASPRSSRIVWNSRLERPAAEDVVEHGQREAIVVVRVERAHADDDMGLLGRALDDARRVRPAPTAPGAVWAAPPGGGASRRLHRRDETVVVDGTGRRQHQVRRAVVAGEEPGDLFAGHRCDRRLAAEHVTTQRVIRVQRVEEQVVHDLVGLVAMHQEFFEDHLTFGVDLGRPERGPGHDVAEDVERHLDAVAENPHVERGVLLGGVRVHLATQAINGLGDLARAAIRGALEQQMLEEVRRAGQFRRLRRVRRRRPRSRSPPSARRACAR